MVLYDHHPMSGPYTNNFLTNCMNRLMKWPLWCIALALALTQTVLGTDPIWPPADQLEQSFEFNLPNNPPPQIDATIFDIENQFRVDFEVYQPNPSIYEPNNTLFYTNNGTMIANSPTVTNGFLTYLVSLGCGFQFDDQTTNVIPHQMADTFYNPGAIRCDSVADGNNLFFSSVNGVVLGTQFLTSIGKCIVNSTNIVNPGSIDVGVDGLIKLTGQSTDLSRSKLNVEGFISDSLFNGFLNTVTLNSYGSVGTDTNGDWNPGLDLNATAAFSSFFPITPFFLDLSNSTSYFNQVGLGTSNVVTRAVFVENASPNVPYRVFIDPAVNGSLLGFGVGAAHVEWDGGYQDPATGNMLTNYLYLTDDYALGASTNVAVINGVPDNYTFVTSTTPLMAGPTPAGFLPVFTDAYITNPFSYMNGTIVAGSAATNASPANPSGAITNLTGQVYLAGTNDLNLNYATISGQNYLSIYSPTQFEGSAGAYISSPYSDINVGKTNGMLTVTNLMVANIPNWSGGIQAWSTRWIEVDTNGVTNDFRVLLVYSDLKPTATPWIRNLTLHGTNSLVISDALNVYGSLSADAQSMTLTTNGAGYGANSLEGELNWDNPSVLGTSSQFPNLQWVTNNGAIRAWNSATFGSSGNSYGAFINNNIIADVGTTIYARTFVNSGVISNLTGAFTLQSVNATLTNSLITASNNISITAGSLVTSNMTLQAGRSLILQVTNLLTDSVLPYAGGTNNAVTNASFWTVGTNGIAVGLNLPIKPVMGDLLGTTIADICPSGKLIVNTWAGQDYGYSLAGYTNNAVIGRLVLDAEGPSAPAGTQFEFIGTNTTAGTTNAIYVDDLELRDYVTNYLNGQITNVLFNPNNNLVIYYAQAVANGASVAEQINHFNGDHFRWVSNYAGYFSSTNILYPDGNYYTFNSALAKSTRIDSDGNGVVNGSESLPFFVGSEVKFGLTITNSATPKARLTWNSIPGTSNYVAYTTNLASPNWTALTNYVSPSTVPPVGGWPITNVVSDPLTNQARFYQLRVVLP